MDLQLKEKRALITGGSKGIGLACAEVLASEGCHLHLAARGEKDLAAAKENLQSKFGVSVSVHPTDLSLGDNARELAERCAGIDILVNNAGAIPSGNLWQVDEDAWRESWDLKVFGYINLCRAVYPHMRSRLKGVIINVIGAAGERPNSGYIAGGAGNAALMAFTKGLGARSIKEGVRVLAVNPGLIKTERLENLLRSAAQRRFNDPERWQDLIPSDPLPGEPRDVADLVAFLASQRARHISGTVITIDGGYAAA